MTSPLDIIVRTKTEAPITQCFDYIVPVDLAHIFRPYLFLPGVTHTDEAKQWITPGLSRTVYFTDGSTAREELLTVKPPRSFTYKVSTFTGINRFLVSHIKGAWQFGQDDKSTTNIEWTYSLVCHNAFARCVVKAAIPHYGAICNER